MLAACYQLQGAPFQLRIYAPESASLKRSTLRGEAEVRWVLSSCPPRSGGIASIH